MAWNRREHQMLQAMARMMGQSVVAPPPPAAPWQQRSTNKKAWDCRCGTLQNFVSRTACRQCGDKAPKWVLDRQAAKAPSTAPLSAPAPEKLAPSWAEIAAGAPGRKPAKAAVVLTNATEAAEQAAPEERCKKELAGLKQMLAAANKTSAPPPANRLISN